MSKSREEALPAWARMLGTPGFRTFVALVENYFADKHISIRLDAEEGVVRPSADAFEQSSVFGLQNIAQTCSQADRDQWHDLIESHFDCIFATSDEQNALRIDVSDFDKVKHRVRARLYPMDLLNQSVETVHRLGPEGTLEVVVLDLPTSVRTISRSEAKAWPMARESLFEIGRRNLKANGLMKDNVVLFQQGIDLHLYASDPYYAASHALILDEYLPDNLANGALVGIPKRDVLLVHYIRNIGAVEAIGSMLQAIMAWHSDGPGSLSSNLYWYQHGEFITLPYEFSGEALNFTPPSDFVEILEDLAERANLS
jgi:hypothetical protein